MKTQEKLLENSKKRILITGAAGYVGAMLVHQFSLRTDVEKVIALDQKEIPVWLTEHAHLEKIVWIQENLSIGDWESRVDHEKPDSIVHTAWQIREMYRKRKKQWQWNIDGSDRVFAYAFSRPQIKKLVHFSTVASYGAHATNRIDYLFTENDPLKKTDYLYAYEKTIAEEHLHEHYLLAQKKASHTPQISIIRPAAITGPRGRFMHVRVGLQSALAGNLSGGVINNLITLLTAWVPITKKWCRQFVHEDDIVGIVTTLLFSEKPRSDYEIFNACPPGAVMTGHDMARAVGKKSLMLHPRIIQGVYFILWHGSQGRIPTSHGGWKSYSYPINVNGSKITTLLDYQYRSGPYESFTLNEGVYKDLLDSKKQSEK